MKVTHKIEDIDFEWDSEKAEENIIKHDVGFPEACEVFLDPFVQPVNAREVDGEAREAVVGLTKKWSLLHVAYAWREFALRIISARKVTKPQRKAYENQ